MKFQFFIVAAISPEKGQEKLNTFCGKYRVISVDKHLIVQGDNSFWSVCVSYIEGEQTIGNDSSKMSTKRGRIDYKEILNEEDFTVYAELRLVRKALADREGVPVYALFTNEQLAEMVTQQVSTIPDLAKIAGIGKARIDKYGDQFIVELNRLLTTQATANETLPHSNS